MFTESFIVLFLLRRSTSSMTQSVQSSTASSWTNTSDEEKLSPLTSHPLSCITHKIVTFSCAHSFLVKSYPPTLNTCRVTLHGHGFTYPATPPYMLRELSAVFGIKRSVLLPFTATLLLVCETIPSRYVKYVSVPWSGTQRIALFPTPTVRFHLTHKTWTIGRLENKAIAIPNVKRIVDGSLDTTLPF